MKTYARIEETVVVEIIRPMVYDIDSPDGIEPSFSAGEEVPIERRFHPDFVASMVDITGLDVDVGNSYVNGVFAPYVPPTLRPDQILAANTAERDARLEAVTLLIAPLLDAVDLGIAKDQEVARLTELRNYRVAVNRVDLTTAEPAWPDKPDGL